MNECERGTSSSLSSSSRKRKSCEEKESSESKSSSFEDPKEKKIVNWRLACYMANEYMTNGTLLGKKIKMEQGNDFRNGNGNRGCSFPDTHQEVVEEEEEVKKQKQKQKEEIYFTIMDLLTTEDVHLPGIVNPTQLAAWMGLALDSNTKIWAGRDFQL